MSLRRFVPSGLWWDPAFPLGALLPARARRLSGYPNHLAEPSRRVLHEDPVSFSKSANQKTEPHPTRRKTSCGTSRALLQVVPEGFRG